MTVSSSDAFSKSSFRGISRRRLLLGTAASAAAAATSVGPSAAQPTTHQHADAAVEPQTREFVLTAEEFDWELMPGVPVRAWGYNGQVPGPELRAREGDLIRVT
ncbi:MAG TPA: multicopper oxidase domain-containing protein, partial [Chloroflexota bacterium]|nr:multicopper oxidase domain-containing protein [Chloroflexota bacterium]